MAINELSATALAATATAITTIVTTTVSFVTMSLTKELKTSEFRQAWIDGLRDDLSNFFGAARAFARAAESVQVHGATYQSAPLSFDPKQVGEFRYQAAEAFSRVKLRLNTKETEHVELLRLLRDALDQQNKMLAEKTSVLPVLTAIDAANEYAPQVLKREWERVKAGERPFRIARATFGVIAAVVLVVFLVYLMSGRFGI
jgi:hypothetical protein